MEEQKVKVSVRHLTKKFGDLLVLNDCSFDVMDGDLLCVVGPTGCGKTTFLNSLVNIYDITDGEILLDGQKVDTKHQSIAYIFQGDSTMPWLTVEENVSFGLDIKKLPKKLRQERVDKYLDIVGLTKYRKYYPKQLSASMLQRVSIARAFATEPELLLMDEPYGQLDIELRFKLEDELVKLQEMTNKPTTVKETLVNNLPRPRDITSPDFIALRNEVTDLIKWW